MAVLLHDATTVRLGFTLGADSVLARVAGLAFLATWDDPDPTIAAVIAAVRAPPAAARRSCLGAGHHPR